MSDVKARNRRTLIALWSGVAVMAALAFAAAPLYDLFCRTTGYGGTPQVAAGPTKPVGERVFTVRFNGDVSPDLPWRFVPEQREVSVRVGEEKLVFYRATNVSSRPVVGTATYNITSDVAASYFNKVQCFCFTEQLLKPGETVEMPVVFFIDPDIVKDRGMDEVKTISLSYTFYMAKTERAKQMLELADGRRPTRN